MNNKLIVCSSSALKLNQAQLNRLIASNDIVDAEDSSVQLLRANDGVVPQGLDIEEDALTKVNFYPYYTEIIVSNHQYLLSEQVHDSLNNEVWEFFDKSTREYSARLAMIFEERLNLVLPSSRTSLLESSIATANEVLFDSPFIDWGNAGVVGSIKNVVQKYIELNLSHVLVLFYFNNPKLDNVLQSVVTVFANYYHVQYLKWRSLMIDKDVRGIGIPYHEILSNIISSDGSDAVSSFMETVPETLTQREVLFLLKYSEREWDYLDKVSTTQQVQYQFIGILTGFDPVSFARVRSRGINERENNRDGKYLKKLISKLTNPKLSRHSLSKFKPIADEINNAIIINNL